MTLKRSKTIDELCYPFIYEHSYLCDYEVATDELCSHVGHIIAFLPEQFDDIKSDLFILQPLVYHLNGSIRGKLAITEENLSWLLQRYHHYQRLTENTVEGFVLPQGPFPAPQCHLARSAAKKAIRIMVRLDQKGIHVPDVLHRMCNLLCNFFFVIAIYSNQQQGFTETPFTSLSYRSHK